MGNWILPALLPILFLGCASDSPEPSATPKLANGSFTAELNGLRIHYAVHGTGPVLMTVPNSWGLSLEGLRAMYRPLEERLTMVYYDPRGIGGSEAAMEDSDYGMDAVRTDFQALREHLGLEQVHAIGWSNGAANLIYLAHGRPETLASAIFLHTGASFTAEDGELFQRDYPDLVRDFEAFVREVAGNPDLGEPAKTRRLRALWLEKYFPAITADPETSRPLLARTFADTEFSFAHWEYTQRTMSTFDARPFLADIPVRSLVIAGRHDVLPPATVRVLADGLPSADFLVLESSGHFGPIEEPETFRDAVFRFLGVD